MVYGVCQCFANHTLRIVFKEEDDIMIHGRMLQKYRIVANFGDFTDWILSSCDSQMLPYNTYAVCVTHRICICQ